MSPLRRRKQSSKTETKEEHKLRLIVQTAATIDDKIRLSERKYINSNLKIINRIETFEVKRDKLMESAKIAKRTNRSNGMLLWRLHNIIELIRILHSISIYDNAILRQYVTNSYLVKI